MSNVEMCGYCRGTGRDPMSDTTNHLPCPDCKGTTIRPVPIDDPELREKRRKMMDALKRSFLAKP